MLWREKLILRGNRCEHGASWCDIMNDVMDYVTMLIMTSYSSPNPM